MTVGAAASLCICAKALTVPGDEFITFAPFFPEYRVFVEAVGGDLKVVPVNPENFQINFESFKALISPKTKATRGERWLNLLTLLCNRKNVTSTKSFKQAVILIQFPSKGWSHLNWWKATKFVFS